MIICIVSFLRIKNSTQIAPTNNPYPDVDENNRFDYQNENQITRLSVKKPEELREDQENLYGRGIFKQLERLERTGNNKKCLVIVDLNTQYEITPFTKFIELPSENNCETNTEAANMEGWTNEHQNQENSNVDQNSIVYNSNQTVSSLSYEIDQAISEPVISVNDQIAVEDEQQNRESSNNDQNSIVYNSNRTISSPSDGNNQAISEPIISISEQIAVEDEQQNRESSNVDQESEAVSQISTLSPSSIENTLSTAAPDTTKTSLTMENKINEHPNKENSNYNQHSQPVRKIPTLSSSSKKYPNITNPNNVLGRNITNTKTKKIPDNNTTTKNRPTPNDYNKQYQPTAYALKNKKKPQGKTGSSPPYPTTQPQNNYMDAQKETEEVINKPDTNNVEQQSMSSKKAASTDLKPEKYETNTHTPRKNNSSLSSGKKTLLIILASIAVVLVFFIVLILLKMNLIIF